ncbi:alpha/beta gliadin family signature family [Trichomonas vaginalis G3]|uniref:alpha/beta gliadin family signature family n=1 Tax=Trichomonas vaginalis (strain ATCC PRA-98 / G3) TaxID=412133 RepID=UPI0021E52ECD|nr:alpha/beta gliadin family signature family [Trichomonas vaginalis G3]KAI5505396.1 alpha/beta gliadin family signature family [Trichomonas vaginalis G3]
MNPNPQNTPYPPQQPYPQQPYPSQQPYPPQQPYPQQQPYPPQQPYPQQQTPVYSPPPEQTMQYQQVINPTMIQAVWVESPLPDHMLFLDSPGGAIIRPLHHSYYPPVDRIVFDRVGNPFKSIYPQAQTTSQVITQETEKLNKKLQPVADDLNRLGNQISKDLGKLSKSLFGSSHK